MRSIFKLMLFVMFAIGGSIIKFIKFIFTNTIFLVLLGISIFIILFIVNFVKNPITIIRPNKELSFDVQAMDGGRFLSMSIKNTTYILFFTGSTCKKCTHQIDTLTKIKEEYDIPIYVIFGENDDIVRNSVPDYYHLATRVISNPSNELQRQVYAYILPHISLVGKNGKIIFDITGNISAKKEKEITEKIAKEMN